MATKKPTKPQSNAPSSYRGFLNVTLSDHDKLQIKQWEFTSDEAISWLEKSVDAGFKLTFSHDDYNRCEMVIGTRQDKSHPDYGLLLTGRGSTPFKAFRQWLYIKDQVIGDDSWERWLKADNILEIDD